jgi:putative transposase
MDGKGRAMDNIMVERLWRTVKYEDIHTRDYESVEEPVKGLRTYFEFYNNERPHQTFGEGHLQRLLNHDPQYDHFHEP